MVDKQRVSGPEATAFIGLVAGGAFLVAAVTGALLELRKTKIQAMQHDDLRQLVQRYEHLAETSLDAQQRAAADIVELRARAAAIEQILRTVE
ncbi:hypothetical protein [Pseudonocardia sp. TRM90224]|uniref:hypothetical protein n=1 Tax=Pseudonocardia sp. TRM90224 TaxID=2812678 RepID=UPI001E342DEA|nr:hypothetical protein [Pseudonocardia sp. TRM90224]